MSGTRTAIIGSCVISLGMFAASAGAAELSTARHMAVAVCNLEHVEPELIVVAEQVAEDVYRHIGVDIEWLNDHCDWADRQFLVILTFRHLAQVEVPENALGFAQSGTVAATVLYDRVHAYARRYHVNSPVLLGYAIAHELGHLLLPPQSHSPAGLMRASIDLSMMSGRRLGFSAEQAALIIRKLDDASDYTAAVRPQNCCDASRAPSAIAASLPQTTSGSTAAWPTQVP
jgi:hypothetical protein